MDISELKELPQKILQKLSRLQGPRLTTALRTYSPLIGPGILILVAILIFVPTTLISNKLKKQIEGKSISMAQRIRSASKNAIARDQWKVEQQYQQALGNDANQISLLAAQTTQRELLSYVIFPKPKSTSIQIFNDFGRQFRQQIERLLMRINAGTCPTPAELDRALPGSSYRSGVRESYMVRPEHRPYKQLKQEQGAIIDELCRGKAEHASVYADPSCLEGYEFWREYEYTEVDTAVRDCWHWQLGYWIIEDVIDTIKELNKGSNSVFNSPVKRLLEVSFSRAGARDIASRHLFYGGRGGSRRAAAQEDTITGPRYVYSPEDGLCLPWTGRVCNENIDVVHFNVRVVVSAEAILPFMRELLTAKRHEFRGFFGQQRDGLAQDGNPQIFKHNQITILQCKISPIDRTDETHWLYRYGEDAVVELDLICEYIFNKTGYEAIKPQLEQMVTDD